MDPIEIISAPEMSGEPINLDLPVHPSGAFELDQWPSACELIDKQTVTSVLPGAVEFGQQPSPAEITVLAFGQDYDKGPHTIPEARCIASPGFDLDGLRLSDGNVTFNFESEIKFAGDADFMGRNVDLPPGEGEQIGDAQCVLDGQRYDCATDKVQFSLSLDARPYQQYVRGSESVYSVDGEENDYSDDFEAFQQMSVEKMLRPVVESAVQRLTA